MKETGPGSRRRHRKARVSPSPSPPYPISLIRRALFATPEFPSPKLTVIHAKTKSKFRKTSADVADDEAPPPVSRTAKAYPPERKEKQLNSIEDVKDFASSQLEKLKRRLDLSHSVILKDLDASHSRLLKRLKRWMQMCEEVMDEVDGEYKKVSEQMSENRKAMKATFAEPMQVTPNSSHVCKVSIKELSHSFEKNLDALRQNFGGFFAKAYWMIDAAWLVSWWTYWKLRGGIEDARFGFEY